MLFMRVKFSRKKKKKLRITPSNLIHYTTDFIWSGQADTSFNLLHILILFYENHWPT